jgi:hypothetical protein
MSYITRCTCTEVQLNLVGCDCDHTGPEKVVKTFEEIAAEEEQAHLKFLAEEEAKEVAYWDAQFAAEYAAEEAHYQHREDYAEWVLEAAKHQ